MPRPTRVPALMLCAALAAALPAAWAGEEPVMPFPGTATEGREAGVPGPAAESPPGTAPDPASAEAAEGPAFPAAAGVAAGPASMPSPSDNATRHEREREARAETPPGGSRLLRVLGGTRKAPEAAASPDGGTPRYTAPVYAAEGCPRALLRRLLAGAAGEADALSALGIEREILTLCRERQEILVALFETEARLRELRAPAAAAAPETAVEAAPAAPVPAAATQTAPVPAAPSPLRAALAATAETAGDTVQRTGEAQAPRYAWFSIIGSAGALRAGITDGTGVWFVREGDALPGGATVASIAGRPPAVRVTGAGEGGDTAPLPYRSRPGGGP